MFEFFVAVVWTLVRGVMFILIPLDVIALLSPEKQGYLHPRENKALLPVAILCFLVWCLWEYAFNDFFGEDSYLGILFVPFSLILAGTVVGAGYTLYLVGKKFLFSSSRPSSQETAPGEAA